MREMSVAETHCEALTGAWPPGLLWLEAGLPHQQIAHHWQVRYWSGVESGWSGVLMYFCLVAGERTHGCGGAVCCQLPLFPFLLCYLTVLWSRLNILQKRNQEKKSTYLTDFFLPVPSAWAAVAYLCRKDCLPSWPFLVTWHFCVRGCQERD